MDVVIIFLLLVLIIFLKDVKAGLHELRNSMDLQNALFAKVHKVTEEELQEIADTVQLKKDRDNK